MLNNRFRSLQFGILFSLTLSLFVFGCHERKASESGNSFIFNPVDSSSTADSLVIPSGGDYRCTILFAEGDSIKVPWKRQNAAANGGHDFLAFVPINGASDHGILFVNHATNARNEAIGNGGGASVLEVFRDSLNVWSSIGLPFALNFDSVGGTLWNSSGTLTPWGTILSGEAVEPKSNQALLGGNGTATKEDSINFLGKKGWSNFGWMVEIDPKAQEVVAKRTAMGRFKHAGNFAMPDGRTFYMLDKNGPSVFFKFVADSPQNLSAGQLYAFKLTADSTNRHWLPIPRGADTLMNARDFAFRLGATAFNPLESIQMLKDGTFLISEGGMDSTNMSHALSIGAQLAPHLDKFHLGGGMYNDSYGRILRYDPKTEKIDVFLESGSGIEDKSISLSNPSYLLLDTKRDLLIIFEGRRNLADGNLSKLQSTETMREIYFLDLNNPSPKIDDLKRFAVLPVGAYATGAAFGPDARSLFFNIQFFAPGKRPPFNRAMTVVITGFPE